MARWLLIAAALALGGCGLGHRQREAPAPEPSALTREEIQSVQAASLYEVIRLLRPRWLARPHPTAFRPERQVEVVVYVDNVRFGGVETLRQITPGSVAGARFLRPSEAEARFGQGHLSGAIVITSYRVP